MKKILLLLFAVAGFAFGVNAQSSQCKIDGGNGYIHAEYTGGNTNGRVHITTEPSKDQPSAGKVLCDITYINKEGKKKTTTVTVYFYASGSLENKVTIEEYEEIVSIRVYGAECTSAR